MSEYQYYEFQAINRPLTEEQQTYMRSLSSRVELTPTRAVFTYSYGDFRGNPLAVLEAHFDALLYLANWGSKRLAFRCRRRDEAHDARYIHTTFRCPYSRHAEGCQRRLPMT